MARNKKDETNQQPATTTAAAASSQAIQRIFKESTEFFSDLFKLTVNKMLQYRGYTEEGKKWPYNEDGSLNTPDWVDIEHCHFFHTVDSKGANQEYCTPVANHFHKMKVTRDPKNPNDIISVECVSGPLKMKDVKRLGKMTKMAVPVNDHDTHTHGVQYLKSDKLSQPKVNSEALKLIGQQQQILSKKVYDENGKKLDDLGVG